MEQENKKNYTVGQPVEAFVDAQWRNGLVTSFKMSDTAEYGVTLINTGQNFYLTPESVRCRREVLLLASDSFEEDHGCPEKVLFQGVNFEEEINFSILPSDDDSLFITPANPLDDSDNKENNSLVHDSFIDFPEAMLTLSTPSSQQSPSINTALPQRCSTPVGNELLTQVS